MSERSHAEILAALRTGLEARGVQSAWGKLRLVDLDSQAMSVTLELERPNYLFEHRFKTTRPSVPLSDLSEQRWFTPALEERKLLEELKAMKANGGKKAEGPGP